jgi:ribose transport system ATP-binding protein
MGENGAGKSTLMKVLGGVYQPDQGTMSRNGQPYAPANPLQARSAGVGFVHQELKMATHMTVAENIYLGRLPTRGWGLVDKARLQGQARLALDQLGVEISPGTLVGKLSVAMQQMVEIAKAISQQSEILIMDEPTASLSARETQHLFEIIERLRAGGTAIVYISHRMEEVFQLCQRITVLRDGKSVGTWATSELDEASLIRKMVGRELGQQFPARKAEPGPELLRVEKLSREGAFRDVSFSVRAGEVVGMGGLVGAGRTEIARCLAGADRRHAGKVFVEGEEVSLRHVRDGIRAGIGYITEDRKGQGLALGLDVEQNVTLASLRTLSNGFWLLKKASRALAQRWVEKLRVRTPTLAQAVKNLSGGNQQKIVIAKWLARDCRVLIFDEPTRGVDVGARAEIYAIIEELAEQGVAILVISSDLPELLGLSDRVLVVHQGRIAGQFSRQEARPEAVISCAFTGVKG